MVIILPRLFNDFQKNAALNLYRLVSIIATKGEFSRCCEAIRNQNIEIEILVCVGPLFNVVYRVAIKIAWLSNGNGLTHLPLDRYFPDIFKRIFMN